MFSGDFPRWTVGVNISYPLGLSAQKAAVARAQVQLNQVQAQLKQIELQVATEVTNAAINVRSNGERVQAAQVARELAQQQLDAENSKFAVGMSTNYFVVQAQNQLATRAEQRAAGDAELPQGPRRTRSPAEHDAAESQHHGGWPVNGERRRGRRPAARPL